MRKKIVGLLVIVGLLMSICPAYAEDSITIRIDGNYLYSDVAPFIMNGRTMVPVRAISEALGCTVEWYGGEQYVEITNSTHIVVMYIGIMQVTSLNRQAPPSSNVHRFDIDVPPMIVDGRTFLPLRAVAESLGADVEWDGNTKTVHISSTGTAPGDKPVLPPVPDEDDYLDESYGEHGKGNDEDYDEEYDNSLESKKE